MRLPNPLESRRAAAVVCALLAVLVYANSLSNKFAYDDVHIITENTAIQSLKTLPHALVVPYWPGRFAKELGLWRPTTTAVLGLEYAVAGENPVLYHAVNLVLHGAVTALVVIVFAELMPLLAALVAGLIFAVHPLHVEAVANVIGVAELLPAALCLWACLLHLRSGERTTWRTALAISVLYAFSFGAKESAVTLPAVLFLLDAARGRLALADLGEYVRRRWRLYGLMVATAGALLAARFAILGSVAHPYGPLGADLLEEVPRIWTLAEVWSHYVRLLVFPMDLSSDYSPNVIPIALSWTAMGIAGVTLTLAILVGALLSWRRGVMVPEETRARTVGFGVVWFLVTVSPVANVVFLAGVLLAERNLYFPSIGFVAAAGWLVARLARERPRVSVAVVALACTLMAVRTWHRNPTWKDNTTVFGQMISDYPYSGRSQWVLGDLFFLRDRPHQGLVSYRAAINILGPHYQLLVEISDRLIEAGRYRGAEHLLEHAWKAHPEIPIAPSLLAFVYSKDGRPAETEHWAREVLKLKPDDDVAYHLLAWALSEQGRWDEAVEARENAIVRGQGKYWQQWTSLSYLREQAGDTAGALAALDSATAHAQGDTVAQIDSLKIRLRGGS